MTRHQWLGSKRWLLFRSKVVIYQGTVFSKIVLDPLYVCKRLRTNYQCMSSSVGTHIYRGINPERITPAESRVHRVPLNNTLMVVAEDIYCPHSG
jgi:hypothetical protein